MKNILLLMTFTLGVQAIGQSPREVVQDQLEAYNAKDIDAFMKVFAEDAALYRYGIDAPSAIGAKELREIYSEMFNESPDLYSEVINRTVIGNKVIDYEMITGRKGQKQALMLVMIYQVENGKILRATSVR